MACKLISLSVSSKIDRCRIHQDFSNNRSLSERDSIAKAGLDIIVTHLDTSAATVDGIGYWQVGNVISALANYDHFAKTKVYQTDVVNTLNSAYSLYAHADQYGYNDDALYVVHTS